MLSAAVMVTFSNRLQSVERFELYSLSGQSRRGRVRSEYEDLDEEMFNSWPSKNNDNLNNDSRKNNENRKNDYDHKNNELEMMMSKNRCNLWRLLVKWTILHKS